MNFKPLLGNVLIKPKEKKSTTASGIVLPDSAKEKPTEGEVIAVGPGRLNDEGKIMPMSIKEGDKILFREYGFNEVEIDDEKYLIGGEDNILGTI